MLKEITAIAAIVLWPIAFVLFQMYMALSGEIHRLRDWIGLIIFDLVGAMLILIEYQIYDGGNHNLSIGLHLSLGLLFYGIMLWIYKMRDDDLSSL